MASPNVISCEIAAGPGGSFSRNRVTSDPAGPGTRCRMVRGAGNDPADVVGLVRRGNVLGNDLIQSRNCNDIGRKIVAINSQERLHPIGLSVALLVGCPIVGVVVLLGVLIATPVAGFALGAALATTLGLAFAMLMPQAQREI